MYKAAGVWAVAGELVLLHWDQWGVIREQGQLSQAAIQNCGAEVCSQHYLWIQFKYEWAIFLTKTHPYTCSPASLLPQIQSDSMETLYQDNNVSSKNKKERKTRGLHSVSVCCWCGAMSSVTSRRWDVNVCACDSEWVVYECVCAWLSPGPCGTWSPLPAGRLCLSLGCGCLLVPGCVTRCSGVAVGPLPLWVRVAWSISLVGLLIAACWVAVLSTCNRVAGL